MHRGLHIAWKIVVGLFGLALLVIIVAWLSGVFEEKTEPGRNEPAAHPVEGEIVEVLLRTTPRLTRAVGTIRAVHESAVASRLLAHVERVHVTAGQSVTLGEVLVELNKADLEAQLRQAQAKLDADAARMSRTESDLERLTELLDRNAATQQELDNAQRAFEVATADVDGARQSISEVEVQLAYATILAPFDGVVIDKQVEEGDLARPGQTLVTLYDPGRLQLIAAVPERLALDLRVGDDVNVEVEALGLMCVGQISEIVPQASPMSRSLDVKVTGPCPPGVLSGMFGRIFIPDGEREQLLVPIGAVRQVGQLEFVQVVSERDGTQQAERRYVRTGEAADGLIEILSGLEAGEKVAATFSESSDD